MAADEPDMTVPAEGDGDLTGITVGRFHIQSRLGAGGMGEVYRAEDTHLRRTVAIKRLSPRLRHSSGGSSQDLLREAQRASALNHPCIAHVFDVFDDGTERFLVMEYVDGITLRERLHQSAVDLDTFCSIASQCVAAVGAAHAKGILHGDIKPANIMLDAHDGGVKVCDFGLARRVASEATPEDNISTTVVQTGRAGTAAYMPPEVVVERTPDARADLFSLGVVFYEMLAGENPFKAGPETLDRILHYKPAPLDHVNRAVPARLSRLVHRMIEKAPARRPATIGEVAGELHTVEAEIRAAARVKRRRRSLWVGGAALALVVVAVSAWPILRGWIPGGLRPADLPANINLVVLPFTESGGGDRRPFFAEGFTEAVNAKLTTLTRTHPLQVASVADVRSRGVTTVDQARDELGANVVLSGRLAYLPEGVEVTSALTDVRTGREIRSVSDTAASSGAEAVQDLVVRMALRMLELEPDAAERTALFPSSAGQPGAYDYYLQGRGYLMNFDRPENVDNAITLFRRALEVDSRYALAYAGLGEAYFRKFDPTGASTWVEPARAACEGALGIDPALAEAHACLGMILNGTGDYEQAASAYLAALSTDSTNDALYLGLATVYERLGRADDAERTYQRAIYLRPRYWAAHNALGAYYYRAGRFDDAQAMFQRVVDLVPDSYRGYSSLGATYFMKGDTDSATAAFEKSRDLRPNYAAASNLATLLYFEGQFARSAELFRQAITFDRGSYQVWGNLAAALEQAGAADEAAAAHREVKQLLEERVRVNPRDAGLHVGLADSLAALGDPDGARASLQRALALKPTDAHTLLVLATYYESRLHQRADALAWLEKAVAAGQTWMQIDRSPQLRDLRHDPRFIQLRSASGAP